MGHKTRLWCSQDSARKQKSRNSTVPGIKHRDTVGMRRYNCNSSLIVACRKADTLNGTNRVISVQLQHHEDHTPYFDVEMPSGASDIICRNLEWSTPGSLVIQIQALYLNVSTNQVRHAWTKMSKTVEKASVSVPVCRNITE